MLLDSETPSEETPTPLAEEPKVLDIKTCSDEDLTRRMVEFGFLPLDEYRRREFEIIEEFEASVSRAWAPKRGSVGIPVKPVEALDEITHPFIPFYFFV